MADNVLITAGAGTTVATDEVNTGAGNAHVQLVKLLDGTDGGTGRIGGSADGLDVQGGVAHDAADSGDPVKIGGKAATATPAVVSAGDRVNAWFDLYGRLVTVPVHPAPSQVAITATASGLTQLIASSTGRIVVTRGSIHNRNATGTVVQLVDGSSTGAATKWQAYLSSGGGGSLFDFGGGWQLSTGRALYAYIDTTGNVDFNISAYATA